MADLTPPDDERATLDGFLDWYRGIAVQRLDGLDLAEATRVVTPSGLTLLGIVKHLDWVEQLWFRVHLLGEDRDLGDNASSFVLQSGDTVESVIAAYRASCEDSRHITAAMPLDRPSVLPHHLFGVVRLRWILLHMIEETAAHTGHQDILRELTDGRTG